MNRHLIRRRRRNCGSGVKSRSKMCNSISNMIVVQHFVLHSYVPLSPPSSEFADGVLSCSTSVIWFCPFTSAPPYRIRAFWNISYCPQLPSATFPLNRFIVSKGHKAHCSLDCLSTTPTRPPSWAIAIRPPSNDACLPSLH